MKGFGRSLKYWAYTMERTFAMMIGMILFILIFMGLMDSGNFLETIRKMLPTYLFMGGLLFVFAQSLGNSTSTFSLTMSMGSTRKSTFAAMMIMIHITVLQIGCIGAIISYFAAPDIFALAREFLPALLGGTMVVIGLGSAVTFVGMKFGQVWGLVFYMAAFFICFFGIFLIGNFISDMDSVVEMLSSPFVLLIGVAVDILFGYMEYRIFRKYEVKA